MKRWLLVLSLLAWATLALGQVPSLAEVTNEVVAGVGEVLQIVPGDPAQVIFVFEEVHASRLHQVEIAIMLDRLYADHGLRRVGLEGLASPKTLDLAWAHTPPPYVPGQPITGREDVFVQTLQDGEISGAEFLGLIYEDVVVHGIDDAALYARAVKEEAWGAPYDYLYAIALVGMTRAQRAAWEALNNQKLYREAFLFAVSINPFTAERYAKLEDQVDVISAEDMIILLDELKAQAAKVKARLELFPGAEENLGLLRDYLRVVSRRSDVMAAHAVALVRDHPGAPIAITIGAMHTARVVEQLGLAGVSVVVVRTWAQANGITAGMLSAEAYRRKEQGLSVAPAGWLGSFLDGRKKPPPVTDMERYKINTLLDRLSQALVWESLRKEVRALPYLDQLERMQEVVDRALKDFKKALPLLEGIKITVEKMGLRESQYGAFPTVTYLVVIPGYRALEITAYFVGMDGTLSKEEERRDLQEALAEAREELKKQETPVPETEPGQAPPPERACSDTLITPRAAG